VCSSDLLAVLKEGVLSDKGFLLFTGGVGTGKTTLINVVSQTMDTPGYLCVISNPSLDIDDFFYYFAAQLGLLFDGNKPKFLFLFSKLLEECAKVGRKVLLIIDEAHALPTDLLEELRLLVNMSAEVKGVLSVFLVGQPELLARLREEKLIALNQRIDVRFHLPQLSPGDTVQYVLFRLMRAGARSNRIFSEKALELVYAATQGNPRQINVLCDNALLNAFSADKLEVDQTCIEESAAELQLSGDMKAFYLKPAKSWWQKVLGPVIFTLIALGVILIGSAIRFGWLDSAYSYIQALFHRG
jgi:general secretion pathway protein A